MSPLIAAAVVGLFAAPVSAADVPDGIYPPAGNGPRVKLSGGGDVTLGTLRTAAWERAEVRSTANDNARFTGVLCNVDRAVDRGEPATVVLVVNGAALPFHSRTEHTGGPHPRRGR